MRQRARIKPSRRTRLASAVLLAVLVVWVLAGVAMAHKGKLPPDALSLVGQASALLAQDPRMLAEVRERLDAALVSRDARGVDLAKVRQVRDALAAGDIAAARRSLADAVVARPAAVPQAASTREASVGQPAVDPVRVMMMAEPLVTGYSGSPGELATLLLGLALVAVGLIGPRRAR